MADKHLAATAACTTQAPMALELQRLAQLAALLGNEGAAEVLAMAALILDGAPPRPRAGVWAVA